MHIMPLAVKGILNTRINNLTFSGLIRQPYKSIFAEQTWPASSSVTMSLLGYSEMLILSELPMKNCEYFISSQKTVLTIRKYVSFQLRYSETNITKSQRSLTTQRS